MGRRQAVAAEDEFRIIYYALSLKAETAAAAAATSQWDVAGQFFIVRDVVRTYSMSDTQMKFQVVSKSVEALGLRLNPVKPDQ